MPGKVNPVIPEAVSQAAIVVMANDQAIAQACAMGNLELNAFLPLVADSLLESLDLLRNACRIFREHCVDGIEADEARCRIHVEGATATLTAIVEALGYEKVQLLAARALTERKSIREIVTEEGCLSQEQFDRLVSPENVARLGSPPSEEKQ
jgi:aspartate ammonia-lyase